MTEFAKTAMSLNAKLFAAGVYHGRPYSELPEALRRQISDFVSLIPPPPTRVLSHGRRF